MAPYLLPHGILRPFFFLVKWLLHLRECSSRKCTDQNDRLHFFVGMLNGNRRWYKAGTIPQYWSRGFMGKHHSWRIVFPSYQFLEPILTSPCHLIIPLFILLKDNQIIFAFYNGVSLLHSLCLLVWIGISPGSGNASSRLLCTVTHNSLCSHKFFQILSHVTLLLEKVYVGLHFLSFLGSPRKLNLKIKRFIKWSDFNFLISQTKKFFNIKLKEFERFIKKKNQNITIYIIMCMCSFSKLWLKSSFQDVKKNVKMIKTELLLLHSIIISIYVQEHFYPCGGLLHV